MGKQIARREAPDLIGELRKVTTPAAYKYEKRAFLDWLEASRTPLDAAVGAWKKELGKPYARKLPSGRLGKKKRRAAKSINKALDAAIYLLRHLLDHSPNLSVADKYQIETAIRKQGRRVKIERGPVRTLTYPEIDRLVELVSETDPKLALWIEALAATGMRVSEMLGLLWTDTKPINGHAELRISGKGEKERTLEVDTELLKRARIVFADETYVFGHAGKPYGRELVSMKIKRAATKYLGRPDVSAHVLRHSYATKMIREGGRVRPVQHDLGHSSAAITLDAYCRDEFTHDERQALLRKR